MSLDGATQPQLVSTSFLCLGVKQGMHQLRPAHVHCNCYTQQHVQHVQHRNLAVAEFAFAVFQVINARSTTATSEAAMSEQLCLQVSLGLCCVLGLAVSHSTFVCTRVNDPLMTSTAGNLKNIIMTVIGAFAFGDFQFSLLNSAGLVMSMVGAIWYAARSALKVRPSMLERNKYTSQVPD